METKIDAALNHSPDVLFRYVRRQFNVTLNLIEQKRLGEAITYLPTIFTREDTYRRYIKWKHGSYAIVEVHNNKLIVDLDDEGLSEQPIQWGNREDNTVKAFKQELNKLTDAVESVSVLEIGANIGYYALIEADIINNTGKIYAIEPHPENIQLLKANSQLNGYDNLCVTQAAIGAEDDSVELFESPKSNRHQVGQPPHSEEEVDRISVPLYSVDSFVERQDIEPNDINLIRMDVEGYESEIFQGTETVLSQDSPMLLFIELHTWLLEKDEFDEIINSLVQNGFELAHAFVEAPHIEGWECEYEKITDIRHDDTWGPKLILKRGF